MGVGVYAHTHTHLVAKSCPNLRPHRLQSARLGFSRQEYWSEWPFPLPGNPSDPGIEPVSLVSPEQTGGFFTTEPPGKPAKIYRTRKSLSHGTDLERNFRHI